MIDQKLIFSPPRWSWALWGELHSVSCLDLLRFSRAVSCSVANLREMLVCWFCFGLPVKFISSNYVSLKDSGNSWVDTRRLSSLVSCLVVSFVTCSSTQDMAFAHNQKEPFNVFWSEYQLRGRGRHGRSWISPLGHGLTFSVSYIDTDRNYDGFALVVSLVILEVLHAFGHTNVGLKWPNDLLLLPSRSKLAGVLVEKSKDRVVIGVGVNLKLLLSTALGENCLHFNKFRECTAVAIINKLIAYLGIFIRRGFSYFRSAWMRHHFFNSSRLLIRTSKCNYEGWCEGVDDRGALLLSSNDRVGGIRAFLSGDVSLCRRSESRELLSC
ncbi:MULTISPECIES: biotin--[acetyl-CoA-carboxylase] ligase [Candidatus Ichthyocystis]|uniref:biotin--[acetyl-CoA-carboxylase] ligase n=1 Tax=Candidatus Ichthyocystis TaxID=2929841 RepID=UPI000B82AACC|nr:MULTISPECIES: biotin--[acetyl-CoA-carboxylase] ligase [Ichthyocystis]